MVNSDNRIYLLYTDCMPPRSRPAPGRCALDQFQTTAITMKTRKFCPHCGRPVVRSRTPGYAFQCHACDEDFYRFEVLNTRQIPLVRELRRIERERRFNPDGGRSRDTCKAKSTSTTTTCGARCTATGLPRPTTRTTYSKAAGGTSGIQVSNSSKTNAGLRSTI